jgi:hypothetical protein
MVTILSFMKDMLLKIHNCKNMYTINYDNLTDDLLMQLAEIRINNTEKRFQLTDVSVKGRTKYLPEGEHIVTFIAKSSVFDDMEIAINFSGKFFLNEIEFLIKNKLLMFE